MSFTRSQIEEMSEADLRVRVLIPLFSAMGYKDVRLYHGHAGEQGKDIVMWKPEDITPRVNYAVVAKKKSITGQVNGSGSAGEVFTQVRQTFGSTYRDPITLEEQRANVCVVVTSGKIIKEAHDSIDHMLRGHSGEGRVRFIDGEKLWELVQEHLGPRASMRKLGDAGSDLDLLSPHHRVTAKVSGKNVELSTEPKHPNAYNEEPLEFKFKLQFDQKPENQQALADMQRFLKSGAPVSLPGGAIKDVVIPELFKPLLGDLQLAEMRLGARKLRQPFHADFRITPDRGVPVLIEGLVFEGVAGSDEVTLNNEQQGVPWHFELRLNLKDNRFDLSCDFHEAQGQNVSVHIRLWEIANALSTEGLLEVVDSRSKLPLFGARLTAGLRERPSEGSLALLRIVLSIQEMTRIPLSIPPRTMTEQELATIVLTEEGLRTGTVTRKASGFKTHVDRAGVEAILQERRGSGKYSVRSSENSPVFILGKEMPVGGREAVVSGFDLSDEERVRLKRDLEENREESHLRVHFEPSEGEIEVNIRYLEWPR